MVSTLSLEMMLDFVEIFGSLPLQHATCHFSITVDQRRHVIVLLASDHISASYDCTLFLINDAACTFGVTEVVATIYSKLE